MPRLTAVATRATHQAADKVPRGGRAAIGYPTAFGLSSFAIARGNAFEAYVKTNGCAELLRLLREHLDLPLPEVSYDDLNSVAGHETLEARYRPSRPAGPIQPCRRVMVRPEGLVVVVMTVRSAMSGASGRWSKMARVPASRPRRSR